MAYNSEAHKRIYQDRKSRGVCTECGRAPAGNGRTTCDECRDKRRVYFARWYHRKNTEATQKLGRRPDQYELTMKGQAIMRGSAREIRDWFGCSFSAVRKWIKQGKFLFIFEIRRIDDEKKVQL